MAPSSPARTGWAIAPAHLTGIFAPASQARDPRGRGSIGAGLVLDAGVQAQAEWRPAGRAMVRLRSDAVGPLPISHEVARRVLAFRPGHLTIELRHGLPIGQGFGMSAAGALATALATARAVGGPLPEARQIAHLADLFGGGGLGGVSAILGGGLEIRRRPGIPPWGTVRHLPVRGTVFLIVTGAPLPSPQLLGDPRFLARVERAAGPGLDRLIRHPSLVDFLDEAERFTDALQVGPGTVLRWARRLRSDDVAVAQAMFGRSLFARPRTARARLHLVERLRKARLPAIEVPVSSVGPASGIGRSKEGQG
jgi:pantoate kinase